MCDLCGNSDSRTYGHSKTTQHKKHLIKLFKLKKELAEKQFGGYFRYELPSKDKVN